MWMFNLDYYYEELGISEFVLDYWRSIPKHFPISDYTFLYKYYYIE